MQVARLTPASPSFVVEAAADTAEVGWTYLKLGIEHILFGYDHLLFVLALMLIVSTLRKLVATVTGFYCGPFDYLGTRIARCGASTRPADRSGDRLEHRLRGHRSRPPASAPIQPDRAIPLGRRIRVRTAARLWLRRRATRYRPAAKRRPARLVDIQSRRRGWPAHVHRRGADGDGGGAKPRAAARRPGVRPPVVTYGIGTLASFWFIERLGAFVA